MREEVVSFHIVLGLDLTFKSIHFVELLSLVVSSTHKEVLREANFPGKHHHYNFDTEGATIDEVTVEQVWVLFRWISIQSENVH